MPERAEEPGRAYSASTASGGTLILDRPPPAPARPVPDIGSDQEEDRILSGKDRGLALLGDHPLVAETPEHLLDDDTTPTRRFFLRENGRRPAPARDPDRWSVAVEGEVERPFSLTVRDLRERFETRTYRMVLECGGNGRAFFDPPAEGCAWTNGGVGCAEWTGIPLRDLLAAARPTGRARFTAHHGADRALPEDGPGEALSRGVPLAKAMEPHSLVVFAMNGEPLPFAHGGPVRLVIPGWPGSLSSKWLTRITLLDREHDGPGMTGGLYRIPIQPIAPGSRLAPDNLRILESMPVRSIISSPRDGARFPAGTRSVHLRGAAWAGDLDVSAVDLSFDMGARWQPATLAPARNRYDWRRWTAEIALPSDGHFEIWARATDSEGRMQPHRPLNWNPNGYGGNAMHHVAIRVG